VNWPQAKRGRSPLPPPHTAGPTAAASQPFSPLALARVPESHSGTVPREGQALLAIDHLAIAAEGLEAGAQAVEVALGVPLEPGGTHPVMGTHNRLLSLGPGEYLEVIAIDAAAPRPAWPRWFALDAFSGPPRPRAWIARCTHGAGGMAQALALAPPGSGTPLDFARGDLRWTMAVPESGWLPYDGLSPALIGWQGGAHPADRLPDRGVRLRRLVISHPQAGALRAALAPLIDDPRLVITLGGEPALAAEFETPHGTRILA